MKKICALAKQTWWRYYLCKLIVLCAALDGPGGQLFFEVAYLEDTSPTIVRGFTAPIQCSTRGLCERQCIGKAQFEAWSARCNRTGDKEGDRQKHDDNTGGQGFIDDFPEEKMKHPAMHATVAVIGGLGCLAVLWYLIRQTVGACRGTEPPGERQVQRLRFSANGGLEGGPQPQPMSATSL